MSLTGECRLQFYQGEPWKLKMGEGGSVSKKTKWRVVDPFFLFYFSRCVCFEVMLSNLRDLSVVQAGSLIC